MKVTVVIPTMMKNKDYLKLCVESLRATVDWDIIVVSNGTKDMPNYSDIHGITAHLHTPQQGQCGAVNKGVVASSPTTDYVFISNDDMYYAPKWLNRLDAKEKWPLVWSPNLVEPTNNAGSAQPFLKLDAGYTLDEFNKKAVDKFVAEHKDDFTTTGFNFPVFINKEVWQTIGGYDEAYDPWGSNSDTDLQTKIELAGIQPLRIRDVLVYHFSNKSGTFDGTHQQEWWDNWNYYTDKWGFNRDDAPIPDTWMATDMVNRIKNKYHPQWENKYGKI